MRIGKNDDAKKKNRRGNKRKLPSEPAIVGAAAGTSGDDAIFDQIDGMHDTLHKKLIEMLMHTMKRVREDGTCKLPCVAILELLLPGDGNESGEKVVVNPFTINLSLAFLTLGINRCTPVDCSALLPGLLQFLECLLTENSDGEAVEGQTNNSCVGVGFLTDPIRKTRHDQTWHLVLRCLEFMSSNPLENAATRRAAKAKSALNVSNTKSDDSTTINVPTLDKTKQLLAISPILGAALFDLIADIFLYTPVPATSSLIPNGLSTIGYERLVAGAASETAGCKTWKEEFVTRAKLKELKLKLLDLVAPCRRFALFLVEKRFTAEEADADGVTEKEDGGNEGMGKSRTVALMVLLSGDTDPDVKSKASSYLRAYMDTYRGKKIPASVEGGGTTEIAVHDVLLGNSVALAQSILSFSVGDLSSVSIEKKLLTSYKTDMARAIIQLKLGLSYRATDNNGGQKKAALLCCRKKVSETTTSPALMFVSKMIDDNPKLFHIGMDMGNDEADVAAVSVGTLVLAAFGDLRQPGSSGSSAVEAVSCLLNSLCLRLTLFYDARVHLGSSALSLDRIQQLLSRSMAHVCAVLAPTSSGESLSVGTAGSRSANTQLEIRDKCYGTVCTLARSQFSLDERYALFDCGSVSAGSTTNSGIFPLSTISTASLLFGCSANESEMLHPRATAALDALLAAYVRVVKALAQDKKKVEVEHQSFIANPWASISSGVPNAQPTKSSSNNESNTDGLSHSLLPLIWNASRCSQPKSSRLAGARWSHELLLQLDSANALQLLCFLSGDDDATVSMLAKKALGIDGIMGEDVSLTSSLNLSSEEDGTEEKGYLPSFGVLMEAIIGKQTIASRPKYDRFHVRAQAVSLRFLLQSLLSEDSFYGDEIGTSSLQEYVLTILRTIALYKGRTLARDEMDLMDECSICLSGCTSSEEARMIMISGDDELKYGYDDIATQALSSNSSKTRRHLAAVMGHLYEDKTLWSGLMDSSTDKFSIPLWLDSCGLVGVAKLCREKLGTITNDAFVLSEVHGAAYLGAACVRAFRLVIAEKNDGDVESGNVSSCWEECCGIVSLLGMVSLMMWCLLCLVFAILNRLSYSILRVCHIPIW